MMQRLGERIDEEECHAVKQINADQTEREKTVSVLFEEMDGVWLNMQDEHHKKMKKHELSSVKGVEVKRAFITNVRLHILALWHLG